MADQPAALRTALAYHHAWTEGDFDQALVHVAQDIVCEAPSGRFEGVEQFRGFMGPFAAMLTGSELVAAHGDDRTAVLVYDTETTLVASAPGAECLRVEGGRIVQLRIIFDRVPFIEARRARAAASGDS